jgi:hypothetical protein
MKMIGEIKEDIEKAKKIELTKRLEWAVAEAELKALQATLDLLTSHISADSILKELERRKNGTN